jgi:hypothetical protein
VKVLMSGGFSGAYEQLLPEFERASGCGNVGAMIPAGKIERGERKQTASEASKAV